MNQNRDWKWEKQEKKEKHKIERNFYIIKISIVSKVKKSITEKKQSNWRKESSRFLKNASLWKRVQHRHSINRNERKTTKINEGKQY